ncbi:MAG TPA: hypothetical protein DCX34_03475 [Roseovarius sp.]|nr:hypothetical protein [Roseovarius sp.]
MKIIRDPQALIGLLENGEFADAYRRELTETIAALNETAGPRGKASGHVTLKLDIKLENGMAQITPSLTSKRPKEGHGASLLWVTEDGELSTEHPRQHDMFPAGPRAVEPAEVRGA